MAVDILPPVREHYSDEEMYFRDLDAYNAELNRQIDAGLIGGGGGGSTISVQTDNQGRPVIGTVTLGYQERYLLTAYGTDENGADFAQTVNGLPAMSTTIYQGLRNQDSNTDTTNPANYTWRQLSGVVNSSFTRAYYRIVGGRQIDWTFDVTAPAGYTEDTGAVLDLDVLPGAPGVQGPIGPSGLPGVATLASYNNRRTTAAEVAGAEGRYALLDSSTNAISANGAWADVTVIQINDTDATGRVRDLLVPNESHIRIQNDDNNWAFYSITVAPTRIQGNEVTSFNVRLVSSQGVVNTALDSDVAISIGFDTATGIQGDAAISVDLSLSQTAVPQNTDRTYPATSINASVTWRAGSTTSITRVVGTVDIAADGTSSFEEAMGADDTVTLNGTDYTPVFTYNASTHTLQVSTANIVDTETIFLGDIGTQRATVNLYQRTATNTAPAIPTGDLIYTFSSTGLTTDNANGWSQGIPAGSDQYIWLISHDVVSATSNTVTITPSDWSIPASIAVTAPDVRNWIFIDVPASTATVDAPDPSAGIPTGWVDSPPAEPTGVIWASEGVQGGSVGNFTWGQPQRLTGVAGRSSRTDIAYATNLPARQSVQSSGTRSNTAGSGTSNVPAGTARISMPSTFNSGVGVAHQTRLSVVDTFTTGTAQANTVWPLNTIPAFDGSNDDIATGLQLSSATRRFGFYNTAIYEIPAANRITPMTGETEVPYFRRVLAAISGVTLSAPDGSDLDRFPDTVLTWDASNNTVTADRYIEGWHSANRIEIDIESSGLITFRDQTHSGFSVPPATIGSAGPPRYEAQFDTSILGAELRVPTVSGTFSPGLDATQAMAELRTAILAGVAGSTVSVPSASGGRVSIDVNTGFEGDLNNIALLITQFSGTEDDAEDETIVEGASTTTWAFDPDVDNAVYVISANVPETRFANNQNAMQALTQMGTAIAALHNDITWDGMIDTTTVAGMSSIDVVLAAGQTIRPLLTVRSGAGTNAFATVEVGNQSTYQLVDYANREVIVVSSQVTDATSSDREFVLAQLIDGIDDNVETPIDFRADRIGSTIQINAQETGQVTSPWVLNTDHRGGDGNLFFGDVTSMTTTSTVSQTGSATSLETTSLFSISAGEWAFVLGVSAQPVPNTWAGWVGANNQIFLRPTTDQALRYPPGETDIRVEFDASNFAIFRDQPSRFSGSTLMFNLENLVSSMGAPNTSGGVTVSWSFDVSTTTFMADGDFTIERQGSTSFSSASFPSGTQGAGNYVAASPVGHNFIGERVVSWGDGEDEPPVSVNTDDYAFSRLT